MNFRRQFRYVVFVALLAPMLSAAQQAPVKSHAASRFAATAPSERIENLDTFKSELKRYHECTCKCGCYARDLNLQADRAIAFLRQRAAHGAKGEKLALVLDIDETTLSNYQEMVKADFAYDSKAFNAWVDAAAGPAIPGTLRLYKEARRLGVSVFFLTGRPDGEREATARDLKVQGFDGWQELMMRGAGEGSSTAVEFKSGKRAGIVAQGYRIVLNVGDQWSDLKGNPEAEYSVKYPNPYYFIP